jgi:5-methylcytosine-specific restriction protein A
VIDRAEKNRKFDQARRRRAPWRKWYFTKTWKALRAAQLELVPWCEPCKRLGKSRPATIANHKIPHRGDRELFFRGALESACKNCHDQAIQREEHEGFSRDIGDDGWPVDPKHLFNIERATSHAYMPPVQKKKSRFRFPP